LTNQIANFCSHLSLSTNISFSFHPPIQEETSRLNRNTYLSFGSRNLKRRKGKWNEPPPRALVSWYLMVPPGSVSSRGWLRAGAGGPDARSGRGCEGTSRD
jgi:hypothetical protein